MISDEHVRQLKELLSQTQTALIIFSPAATLDQLCVSASLFASLKEAGKDVRLLCHDAEKMVKIPDSSAIIGLDAVQTEMGNQNLTISFEYDEHAVDKVSYYIGEETNRFYLTIKPQKNQQPLDSKKVEFSYTGAEADIVFMVGVQQLESLEQLYFGYEDLYRNSPVVTINTYEPDFGLIKLDVSGGASQSEVVAKLLESLELPLSSDSATNLLLGIDYATDSFRSMSASAGTFEMVANLMKRGGRRLRRSGVARDASKQTVSKQAASKKPDEPEIVTIKESKKSGDKPSERPSDKSSVKKSEKSKDADEKPGGLKYQPGNNAPRS